jgi:pyridoxal 5'-phosphate synthase pdxT subunit
LKKINIGILGVQGDVEEHESAVNLALYRTGIEGETIRVKAPSQSKDIQGLIIPGGESTSIGRLTEPNTTLQTLRDRVEKGLPTLGTCAGLIMLANKVYDKTAGETRQRLLGGLDIVVERNAFGRQKESFEVDLEIPLFGQEKFRGVFIRSPIVKKVGPKVETLSKLNETIVAVKQENVLGTSFHPELSGDTRLHEYFVRLVSQSPIIG